MEKISVIIPAYQSAEFIERCLRSLDDQSLDRKHYEVIVVLDGPDNLIKEIIENKFPKTKLLTHARNLGLPSALNTGLLHSKCQYVVRVDSDDYVSDKYLEYLLYTIETNPNYKAVSCDYIEVDINEIHVQRCNAEQKPIGCGIIFSRQALISLGLYNTEFLAREDEELMQRFDASGNKKLHIPLPLYRYRRHDGSITSDKELMQSFLSLLPE